MKEPVEESARNGENNNGDSDSLLLEKSLEDKPTDADAAVAEAEEQVETTTPPPSTSPAAPTSSSSSSSSHFPAHVCNQEQFPAWLRFGMPIYLLVTLALLLASDIGSGVTAVSIIYDPNNPLLLDPTSVELFRASVFTSIGELWETGSYALTMLVVIASVSWPYVKLLLSFFAWLWPFRKPRRRERLLEVVDALGKWSFVDIIVFIIIVVTFRSTIELGANVIMEVYVVPQWGLVGFVTASFLSLAGTQLILHFHRRVIYDPVPKSTEEDNNNNNNNDDDHNNGDNCEIKGLASLGNLKRLSLYTITFLLMAGFALYLVGCLLLIYRVTYSQAGSLASFTDYSIISTGTGLPDAAFPGKEGIIRWLQFAWFVLFASFPLLSNVLFGALLWAPLSKVQLERLFVLSEIAFAWGAAEVVVVSVIFAVVEIPTFGNGLQKSGCASCYKVGSQLLPELAVIATGAVVNLVASCWLFALAHRTLYDGRLRSSPRTADCTR